MSTDAPTPSQDVPQVKPDNGKHEESAPPPQADFKICEVWVKSGQRFVEAPKSFWTDKCKALGVLEYCKDIVKSFTPPAEKGKIIQPKGQMMDFVRNGLRKKK